MSGTYIQIQHELKSCLPHIYKALLSASCASCPSDPLQFLKTVLVLYQGHHNIEDVDWCQFLEFLKDWMDNMIAVQKVHSWYKKYLMSFCFRRWKEFTVLAKRSAAELRLKTEKARRFTERKLLRDGLSTWAEWVEARKETKAVAVRRLQEVADECRLKLTFAAWRGFTKDSRRIKEELLKRFGAESWDEISKLKGEGLVSLLSYDILLKIFQYLNVRDLLNCAEVSCKWKSIIQSGELWSRINFSVEGEWVSDSRVQQVLQNYSLCVTHLNLRACAALDAPSFQSVCGCRNLQELNVSECPQVTDAVLRDVLQGCPYLLYLNLSSTCVTDHMLGQLFRTCENLQYLSVAHCSAFTDDGFLYLAGRKVGYNLIYLDLSGCTQMTVDGFAYISAGCRSLREVVMDDMPTLSDRCVLALLGGCNSLSAMSLQGAPHLSDVALTAIADNLDLEAFRLDGNNQLTDASWQALCRSSRGLRLLHAAECPRMSDASLKAFAALRNLQHLNISLCSRVSDVGIQHLTEGPLRSLRELDVSHCRITDASVVRIVQRLRGLEHLNLSHCEELTDSCLDCFRGSSIRSLDISGCGFHDRGLSALEAVELRTLALAECVHVTDVGIETLCKNVADLEDVDMSRCTALTQHSIKAVSARCAGLRALRVSGCPEMTDQAMRALAGGCAFLRELDVSGCVRLTDRTVEYLCRSPQLSSVRMSCCPGISTSAALKLKPRLQFWEHNNHDPSGTPWEWGSGAR